MTDDQPITTDPKGQSPEQPTVPAKSDAGQTTPQTPSIEELPEKFKGKSATDIAKMHLELEKKLGENSQELGKSREESKQWAALGQVIKGNPVLVKAIEDEIARLSSPNPQNNNQPKVDDTRVATTGIIIGKFEDEFGISQLKGEEKSRIQNQIGKEIQAMRDPSGKLSQVEAFNSIPLDQLPQYMARAYKLVTAGMDDTDKVKVKAMLEARQNIEAGMGSMSFSGAKDKQDELTPDEKKVAQKMKISEDQYLQNKKEINS